MSDPSSAQTVRDSSSPVNVPTSSVHRPSEAAVRVDRSSVMTQVLSMLYSADFSLDWSFRPQWYLDRIHILEYVQ